MNRKPNLPDELNPGKEFSFRADWRVNRWAYAGMVLAFAGDLLLHCYKDSKDWPVALRVLIALAPLPPFLLWIRSFARWLRGMDELDRQITLKNCLFATTATLYLYMAVHPLAKWGVVVVGQKWWLLDWHSWWLQGWVMTCFYILGTRIFPRRYQ